MPVTDLNTRLKWVRLEKPVSRLISVMFLSVSRNMRWAFMIRVTLT